MDREVCKFLDSLNYDYKKDLFIVTDISNYDNVYVNNKVYTSGYGTIKENLYIY